MSKRRGQKPVDYKHHKSHRQVEKIGNAGDSYNCESIHAIRAIAEQERARTVHAAGRLRGAGMRIEGLWERFSGW